MSDLRDIYDLYGRVENFWEFYRSNPAICWEMFKFIRPRELAFVPIKEATDLPAHRYINVGRFRNFMMYLCAHYKDETRWNLFASIEYVRKTCPRTNEHLDLRKMWLRWGWDIVIDFDAKPKKGLDLWDAWAECLTLCELYDSYGIMYWIKFTGGRGFHVTVPWRWPISAERGKPYLQALFRDDEFPKIPTAWVRAVVDALHLKTCDLTTTYRYEGLIRVPYSLHPKTGLVALPLTHDELRNFDPVIAHPAYVKTMDVTRRSLCMMNTKADLEGLKEFVRDYVKVEVTA